MASSVGKAPIKSKNTIASLREKKKKRVSAATKSMTRNGVVLCAPEKLFEELAGPSWIVFSILGANRCSMIGLTIHNCNRKERRQLDYRNSL